MEIVSSILDLVPKTKEEIKKLSPFVDYIHIDVMDGKFVQNISFPYHEVEKFIDNSQKYDVHLMVEDVKKYIPLFCNIHPEYITFHLEVGNTLEYIKLLKEKNIKIGISIKPDTKVRELIPYLSMIDLVLVMSVEPGKGGQPFLENTIDKIEELYNYREKNNLKFKIEVDGGVNDQNISKLTKCDMIVIGSFITKGNYEEQITKIKGALI